MVIYRVLGPLTVSRIDGGLVKVGGPRQQLVLAALLMYAGRAASEPTIIDVVWGSDPPETARSTIQTYISRLRTQLGGEAIDRVGDGYRLMAAADEVDAQRFERTVEEGRHLVGEDPHAAARVLREGLGLWYGLPYGGLDGGERLLAEVVRLRELRLAAVEAKIDADLAVGSHARVVAELETLVREHPFRERFRAQQMLALYAAGRQADALDAYQRARELLVSELGVEPSSQLRDLERRILDQDPSLIVGPQLSESPDPPGRSSVASAHASGSAERLRTAPPPEAPPEDILRGYELREAIGEGDFGVVHRAYQPSVGREVAVKVIRSEYANRPDFVRRFEQEARLVAQLEHPHITPLHDYWRDPDGAFLVMPLLRGGSLATALSRGAWHLGPALRVLGQIGGALAYAHRRGLVHRDVKPSNVLLDAEGNAYLSDFGIAVRDTDDVGLPVTTSPAYLPPEEVRGEGPTAASDIYGLGMLTWHLLAGTPPPTAGRLPPLSAVRSDLPEAVDDVLACAVHEVPQRRYDQVESFLRAVRQAVGADMVEVAGREDRDDRPARNPYKGLRAFSETDAADFFGRQALVDELLAAVVGNPVTLVVGPSGSGKSSLVRAGLVPALRSGGAGGARQWLVSDMFPGTFPFEELTTALLRVAVDRPATLLGDLSEPRGLVRASKIVLPDDDSVLLLVIDQFEELFSSVASEQTRRAFLDNLVAVAADERTRVRVVATLRADFFDRPLGYGAFAEAVGDSIVTVGMPTRDGLAQAIVAPAHRVGVGIEPGLVSLIAADVEDQPGGLPLLQYTLTELFAQRDSGDLTIAGYEAIGGVTGALARRAEALYEALTPAGQQAASTVLLRLVSVEEGVADTRRRARRAELHELGVEAAGVEDVLRQFASHRLLSFDVDPVTRGPTVEVAHEALLSRWDRLRRWIDAHRDELALRRRIATAAQDWADADHDPSYLLRGARLEEAVARADGGMLVITAEERRFLDASIALRDAEAAAAARRRRRTLVGLVLVLVVVALAAGVALVQRAAARDQALSARVRELAGEALLAIDEDPQLALHLALEAVARTDEAGRDPLPEALGALHQAAQSSRLVDIIELDGELLGITAGGVLAEQLDDGTVVVTDVVDGRRTTLDVPAGEWFSFEASADGRVISLVGQRDNPVTWVVVDDEGARTLEPAPGSLEEPMALAPDGALLAGAVCSPGDCDGWDVLLVWDVASGRLIGSWSPDPNMTRRAFLPDGDLVVTAAEPPELMIVDPTSGEVRRRAPAEDEVEALSGSRDGNRIAVLSESLTVYDVADVTPELSVDSVTGNDVVWSPDGTAIAVTGNSGVVQVFDAGTGRLLHELRGATNNTTDLIWPVEGVLAHIEFGESVLVFDVSREGPAANGTTALQTGELWVVAADADRGWLVATTSGGIEVFDLETRAPLATVGNQQIAGNWRVDPSFSFMLGFEPDGTSTLLQLPELDAVAELPRCRAPLAVSPDGAHVAVNPWGDCIDDPPADMAVRLQVLDTSSRDVRFESESIDHAWSAAFSSEGLRPAGRYMVATAHPLLELVDTASWEVVGRLGLAEVEPEEGGIFAASWDPGGRHIVFSTSTGRTVVVDVAQVVDGSSMVDAIVFNRVTNTGAVVQPVMDAEAGIVVTHGFDATLRVWDLATDELALEISTGGRHGVGLVRGASTAFYAGPDQTMRRLDLGRDAAVKTARALLVREMTTDECARHVIDPCPTRLGADAGPAPPGTPTTAQATGRGE